MLLAQERSQNAVLLTASAFWHLFPLGHQAYSNEKAPCILQFPDSLMHGKLTHFSV